MTENKKEPTFELQSWFDGGDIFFRPKDKRRLTEAVDAIVENDLGVAIIGSNEVVLDHYCRMLVARMREVERFQLDVFLPVTTDSVLSRFNKMLAEISLEEAAKPPAEGQPVRLLVINDARVVNQDQWGLLVRLLADFPGVNARLVLVINKSGWPAHEKLLHSLGKKMHRWVVNVPAIDEARLLMDAAEDGGHEAETHALLIDVGLGTLVASRQRSNLEQQELDPDLPELPELDVDVLLGSPDADELEADAVEESDSSGGSFWRTTMIVSISLALSSMALLWLYDGQPADQPSSQSLSGSQPSDPSKIYTVESIAVPTDVQIEAKRLKAEKGLALSAETPSAVIAESSAPETLVENPVVRESVVDGSIVEGSIVVETQAGMLFRDVALNDEIPPEEFLPEELLAEKLLPKALLPKKPSGPEPLSAPLSTEEPPVLTLQPILPEPQPEPVVTAQERAVEKVASASASAYFVQHTVLSTEIAANGYLARYQVLNQALIVPIRLRQGTVYSIVSGPFNSRSAAALFTQNKAIPNDYWIRNAVQLQAVLRR
mgnify:CR=1|jgi:hypothetical protein